MSLVNITSLIPGVSYSAFLAQTQAKPFKVKKTELISTSAGQVEQPITITYRDGNGHRKDISVTPVVDPYQQLTGRIEGIEDYTFDGFTRLRFNQINGSATLTLKIYPSKRFDAVNLINEKDLITNYEDDKQYGVQLNTMWAGHPIIKPYVFQLINSSSSAVSNVDFGDAYETLNSSNALTYSRYDALLTQTGTNAPTAIILENTLGGTIVWTRTSEGVYVGTLAGAFISGKTWLIISNIHPQIVTTVRLARVDADTVTVVSGSSDGALSNHSIEIRVYP